MKEISYLNYFLYIFFILFAVTIVIIFLESVIFSLPTILTNYDKIQGITTMQSSLINTHNSLLAYELSY